MWQQAEDEDLDALYERVRPRLRAMASRFVGWDEAEDLVQEAFVRALAFPGIFRHHASTSTWVTRILVNVAIDETRRRKRRPSCVATLDVGRVAHPVSPNQQVRLELKEALAAGSRIDREVLLLAGLLGFSCEETARRLELTAGTMKSRLWHARRRLRNRAGVGHTPDSRTTVK